ncbi:hypothetical protein ACVCAH_22055 [Micromonospora sp. LZ34]
MTAGNVSYTATIAPNASVSLGLQATHTADTGRPVSFTSRVDLPDRLTATGTAPGRFRCSTTVRTGTHTSW